MQRSDTLASRNLQTEINPIQLARVDLGYTQETLAAVAGVTKIFVQHLEFGMVVNPPYAILKQLRSDDVGFNYLKDAYSIWCCETRDKNSVYFTIPVERFLSPHCNEYGNWLTLRESISESRIGFCKLFCLHPQILSTFEKNWSVRTEFTPGMRELFKEAGIDRSIIARMDMALLRRNKEAIY